MAKNRSTRPSSPDTEINPIYLRRNAIVVDDELEVRSFVANILKEIGFSCDQAADISDVRRFTSLDDVHLFILDLSLGKHDAIDVLEYLSLKSFQGEVVLMSGHDTAALQSMQQLGTRLGLTMIEWLRKPFQSGELKQIVDHLG